MKATINKNIAIIINGNAGSGKTTFVNLCSQINSKVMNYSSVAYVKDVARFCGWDGKKDEKDRKFLSSLKDILTEWNDLPFKSIYKFVNACKGKIIFIDSREPYDIDRLKDKFNAVTLCIQNDRIKPIVSNHADKDVSDYAYDYIIYNNGDIDSLKDSARIFLEEITK